MILTLRRRHRLMISLAALTAPLVLYVALSGRTAPVTDATPLVARNIPAAGTVLLGENTLALTTGSDTTQLLAQVFAQEDSGDAAWTLVVGHNAGPGPGPDVLVYVQQSADAGQLATDATLLGPFVSQRENRYVLPADQASDYLVLYSLAHQSVLGTFALHDMFNQTRQ